MHNSKVKSEHRKLISMLAFWMKKDYKNPKKE